MAAIRNIRREVISYKEFASGEEARRIASTRPKTGQSYRRGLSLGAVTNLRFIGVKRETPLDCISMKRR